MQGDSPEECVAVRELIASYPNPVPARQDHERLVEQGRVRLVNGAAFLTCVSYKPSARTRAGRPRKQQEEA